MAFDAGFETHGKVFLAGFSHVSRTVDLRDVDIGGEHKDVTIRLAQTEERIQAACDLINHRYSWRGYGHDHRIPAGSHHVTFTAEVDGEIVGTITLAVDSPKGLAIDRTFKDEIDKFRAMPTIKVCELTKFAFCPQVQSKKVMAALFHIVFVYGRRTYGSTDLFIEVNRRHVRFYEAMLGFRPVCEPRMNEAVSAGAQLMWLKVAAIRDYIDRLAGTPEPANSRSLYPFFLSPQEETGIYRRLAGVLNDEEREGGVSADPLNVLAQKLAPQTAAPALA
jgi:hypothetical protein